MPDWAHKDKCQGQAGSRESEGTVRLRVFDVVSAGGPQGRTGKREQPGIETG